LKDKDGNVKKDKEEKKKDENQLAKAVIDRFVFHAYPSSIPL